VQGERVIVHHANDFNLVGRLTDAAHTVFRLSVPARNPIEVNEQRASSVGEVNPTPPARMVSPTPIEATGWKASTIC
jgi:hypothetical protein